MEQKTLGIISAAKCNLNCSYCYLHKNQSYINEDEKIVAAMNDGSFLNNIKRSLLALYEDYNNFTRVELWGGETSLHFLDGSDFFKNLLITFPAIREISYSTNFRTGIKGHLHLIDLIEQYSTLPIELRIQISVDGPTQILLQTRHYKYEDLETDVKEFIELINQKKLNKTKVFLHYKSTLPWKNYKEICSSTSSLIDYLDFWYDVNQKLQSKIINGNFIFNALGCFAPALEYPYPYTIQDGLDFASFSRKIDALKLNERYKCSANMPLLTAGFYEKGEARLYSYSGQRCGMMDSVLLFKRDGTLSPCSNGFMETFEDNLEWLKENDPEEYRQTQNTKNIGSFINEDGQADLKDLKNKVARRKEFWKYHADTVVSITNAEMYELAMARQISPIYAKNSSLRFKHSLHVLQKNSCYFNNTRRTGSPYVSPESLIKLYCNGLGEYYEFGR